ncbi:TPA: hypothetical protein ACIRVA_000506 [Klebsiella variicola]
MGKKDNLLIFFTAMADNEGKKGSAKGKRVPEAMPCTARVAGQKAHDVLPIWRKATHDSAMSLNGD